MLAASISAQADAGDDLPRYSGPEFQALYRLCSG